MIGVFLILIYTDYFINNNIIDLIQIDPCDGKEVISKSCKGAPTKKTFLNGDNTDYIEYRPLQ